MLRTVKNRRGMTLAEIMVCLGVVAIMITMVVSFAVLLGDRTRASSENTSAHQDLTLIQSGVDAWANSAAKYGAQFAPVVSGTPFAPDAAHKTTAVVTVKGKDGKLVLSQSHIIRDTDAEIVDAWDGELPLVIEFKDDAGNVTAVQSYTLCFLFTNNTAIIVNEEGDTESVSPDYSVTVTFYNWFRSENALSATVLGEVDGVMCAIDTMPISFSYGMLEGTIWTPAPEFLHFQTESVRSIRFDVLQKTVVKLEVVELPPDTGNDTGDNAGDDTQPEPQSENGNENGNQNETESEPVYAPEMLQKVAGTDELLFCTVEREGEDPHTFTVNPRVGESAAGSVKVEVETEE